MIERPIFVVAPPGSGAELIVRSLRRAEQVWTSGREGPGVLDEIAELQPSERGWDSNRLTAAEVTPVAVEELRTRLKVALTDREGRRPGLDASGIRWLDGAPRGALRVPFLDAVCPDATFVYLLREPAECLAEMLAGWRSGRLVTYPELPDWPGPPWSYLLVPGWRELGGRELAEIVGEQWSRTAEILLDDLEGLAPERWCAVDHATLLKDPRAELERLCGFLGLEADEKVSAPMRLLRDAREVAKRSRAEAPDELAALLPRTEELAGRAREWLARPLPSGPSAPTPAADSPLRSVHTGSMPQILDQLGTSLLVTTYQTGKLICARHDRGTVNTHFRDFNRPMGITAWGADRFALGTRSEVLDYRNFPEVAAKLDPPGRHDACFLPRNRHFTGDIQIHEVAFARGELWLVATSFSCLATLDASHSFVPRWTPPFITELQPEDRCHLNGLCVIDDEVRFVTALGETDEPGGWRPGKASGGVVIDVPSGELVLTGISMPHSPRWHQGRLWMLESGRGTIAVADLEAGTWETVAELPGFTRGLAFAGGIALVGLSQIRESSTFGGLPIEERLDERLCGVWAVDTESGNVAGFLRFEELVQEIFDVAILPGVRYPEIAEEGSDAALRSYKLP
jgi:uncharacterized protein (TIGR03032 family)